MKYGYDDPTLPRRIILLAVLTVACIYGFIQILNHIFISK